jgi:hypothetical protein
MGPLPVLKTKEIGAKSAVKVVLGVDFARNSFVFRHANGDRICQSPLPTAAAITAANNGVNAD